LGFGIILSAMMKWEIVISLTIGSLATVMAFLMLRQCGGPSSNLIIQEQVRHDTLRFDPDTVFLPGTLSTAIIPVDVSTDSSDRILRDSLALMHARLDRLLQSMAASAVLSARADSIVTRTALLRNAHGTTALNFSDTVSVEYQFPPNNSFCISHGIAELFFPPDTIRIAEYQQQAWWVDITIGLGGALITWLLTQADK
jgi:hypothetical protein